MLFSCHWPLLTYLTSAHLCISAAILNHQLSWYSYSLAPLGRGVIWCVGVSTSAVIGGSLLCYLLAPGRAGVALDMWAYGTGVRGLLDPAGSFWLGSLAPSPSLLLPFPCFAHHPLSWPVWCGFGVLLAGPLLCPFAQLFGLGWVCTTRLWMSRYSWW